MTDLFNSILSNTEGIATVDLVDFLSCTAVSLVLGLAAALFYMYRNSYNKSFVVTLALLPPVVQLVIMLVNGNLGAGLAVMGAFALVRFRSIPGSARDIAAVFTSMAIGLATGMGFLAIAAVFTLIIGLASLLYTTSGFGEPKHSIQQLKITIPEDLDYQDVFDTVFAEYTDRCELRQQQTSNMGSLYKLYYTIELKPHANPKQFIDELRTRNGNLKIALGRDLFRANGTEL
ncbi:MAG: DUF4956 domain-containing protein [Coriobacteriales bacterium]|jgi:uncharacterized membrane protein YhiD involved in acid resistance|nr:DUF4956 domain-containing protein [Coriobacteriales bacterium]